jgi:GH18 family chitinase
LILDLGLDGIDIDYEWCDPPPSPITVMSVEIGLIDRADATTMEGTANLMVELRAGLDAAAQEIGAERLLLSVCISSEDL